MSLPKKVLLLYCADETRRSILAFMLRNSMYKVVAGITQGPCDYAAAVFVDDCLMETADLAYHVHLSIPLIVLLPAKRLGVNFPERSAFMKHPTASIELLEKIRVLTARKRGPKKHTPTEPPSNSMEAKHPHGIQNML